MSVSPTAALSWTPVQAEYHLGMPVYCVRAGGQGWESLSARTFTFGPSSATGA